jgi:putative sigma-54 modulation protein
VQVNITARHGHLSDATQQFIREKAEKLHRFFERLATVDVTVDLKDENKRVEFLVTGAHRHEFVAQETHPDVLAAVDLVINKLEGQLRRFKEKVKDRRRTPSAGEVAGASAPEETPEE